MPKFRVTLVVTTQEQLDEAAMKNKIQGLLPYVESYESLEALLTDIQEIES